MFVTKAFARFARKERLSDTALIQAIELADRGIVAANLGGCLVKLRVPREGEGKSGGYRTLVAYRTGERAFFLFGFAKNEAENIGSKEQIQLEAAGEILLAYSSQELADAVQGGRVVEIQR